MALRWVTTVSSPCSSQSRAADAVVPKFSCSTTLYQSHRTFTFPLYSTDRLSLRRNSFSSTAKIAPFRCFASALTPELKSTLDKVVTSNKVVLFMKGTKDFPQCGFSNTVVQILKSYNVPFETINILENEVLRSGLKEYSSWPTFPQLYIDGEFFGGCDITIDAYQNGELQEILEKHRDSGASIGYRVCIQYDYGQTFLRLPVYFEATPPYPSVELVYLKKFEESEQHRSRMSETQNANEIVKLCTVSFSNNQKEFKKV